VDSNLSKTLRGIIRRMRFAAPDVLRVGGAGFDPEPLRVAAEEEGISLDFAEPEGWIVWAPEAAPENCRPPGSSCLAVTVVAPDVREPPLPNAAREVPARVTMTLREWVGDWPCGRLLAPLLASDAVGARTCRSRLHGATEYLFLKNAPGGGSLHGNGRAEELAVTALGIGFFPVMPATLACLVMLPFGLAAFVFLGAGAFIGLSFVVAAAASVAAVALERWAGARFLAEDPREFVLDEVAGMAFTWALIPVDAPWWAVVAGFLFFRLFDIFKWGIAWIEKVPVRGSILWDDLLAGLYAGLCVIGVCFLSRL